MIQRKQSLWLLLAALLGSGEFYFDIYHRHTAAGSADLPGMPLRAMGNLPLLLLALAMTLLPLVAIFLYKSRRQQVNLCIMGLVSIIAFLTIVVVRAANEETGVIVTYWIGTVLPVISLVLMIMAMSDIRKDEKLVRSVDRLR